MKLWRTAINSSATVWILVRYHSIAEMNGWKLKPVLIILVPQRCNTTRLTYVFSLVKWRNKKVLPRENVRGQEVYRLHCILSMACPVGGRGEEREKGTPVLVLAGGRGYPCPKTWLGHPPAPTPSPLGKDLGPETRNQGPVVWGTLSPLLTDTHLWKQYLPHPSDEGGNETLPVPFSSYITETNSPHN